MNGRGTGLAVLAVVLASVSAYAAAPAAPRVPVSTKLVCEFDEGVFRAWGDRTTANQNRLVLVYTFDPKSPTSARLVGNAGSADVMMAVTRSTINFVETTASGNLNSTTIYRGPPPSKAVHSRHTGTPGQPFLSQMYGSCE